MSRRRGRGGMPAVSGMPQQQRAGVMPAGSGTVSETNDLSNVTVNVVKPAAVSITVDLDRLKWEHAEMMQQVQDPNLSKEEQSRLVFAVLEAVTGQDMRDQPLRVVNAVLDQIKVAFGDNPGN